MVAGTTIGTTSRTRLVAALDKDIEIELAPHMGIFRNRDVPGMIGEVGSILGQAGINIASMAVSRNRNEGRALMAVAIDSPASAEAAEAISKIEGFEQVWFVNLEMGNGAS
jgi:D-3-phosphoglycerate dehydrogenase